MFGTTGEEAGAGTNPLWAAGGAAAAGDDSPMAPGAIKTRDVSCWQRCCVAVAQGSLPSAGAGAWLAGKLGSTAAAPWHACTARHAGSMHPMPPQPFSPVPPWACLFSATQTNAANPLFGGVEEGGDAANPLYGGGDGEARGRMQGEAWEGGRTAERPRCSC